MDDFKMSLNEEYPAPLAILFEIADILGNHLDDYVYAYALV